MNFAEKILAFNHQLEINTALPQNIEVLNPFKGTHAKVIWPIVEAFYKKFYADNLERKLILGINPGRLGAGSTGLPFTDTKRLIEACGIAFDSFKTHEPSSAFVYEVIDAFGGPQAFYKTFYIGSVCPLGFVTAGKNGMVNINYYDDKNLEQSITPFIVQSLKSQIDFGLERDKIYVLGTGKNFAYLDKLNNQHGFAKKLIPLEHPRFVMQYRAKQKSVFIDKYLQQLSA